jgi:hypothetical protein
LAAQKLAVLSVEARQTSGRVQMLQQINNLEYCLSKLSECDQSALDEAIRTLDLQATIQAVE